VVWCGVVRETAADCNTRTAGYHVFLGRRGRIQERAGAAADLDVHASHGSLEASQRLSRVETTTHHTTIILVSIPIHHHRDMNGSGRSVDNGKLAPWLEVPSRAISVVEHPCIVKNIDKGITSLGGEVKLSKALSSVFKRPSQAESQKADADAPDVKLPQLISVSLRPDDPYAKRLLATPVTTGNVLLKVTVPKRTGRKRRRGTSGPFEADPNAGPRTTPLVDASTVFRSIRDNATKYSVAPVGVIDEAHRFRTLPDMQYAASRDPTMQEIKNNLMPLNYSHLKNYHFNTAAGADLTRNVGISAEFLQMPVQYGYKFQQNPFVKYTGDAREEINVQKRLTYDGYYFIKCDVETVPRGPKPFLAPEYALTPYVQTLIARIREELHHRPIITRHTLYNKIGWKRRERIREAAVYCGYFFESGPWREALIKWGVDPRKDPEYRKYQTISFLSYLKVGTARSRYLFEAHVRELAQKSSEELRTQHTFDGVNVSHTGNLFQFCDISDPLIRKILDTEDIRDTCAPTFQGWYHAGTWAKATVILKHKMNLIIESDKKGKRKKPTNLDDIYQRVASWPENWDDGEIYATYRKEVYDKDLHKEKVLEHDVMYTVRAAARNPKYAFEKMEARDKRHRDRTAEASEETEGDVTMQDADENVEQEGEDDSDVPEDDQQIPEDMTEAIDDATAIMNEGGDDDSEANDDFEEGNAEVEEDAEGETEDEDEDEDEDEEIDDGEVDEDDDGHARPFGGLFK
jgi:general transcription factor 3C polypeptide 5 (transcription factor C subunit 1)